MLAPKPAVVTRRRRAYAEPAPHLGLYVSQNPSMTSFLRSDRSRAVAVWLLVCAVLVFAMVIVGGATRLTDSGLSITEW